MRCALLMVCTFLIWTPTTFSLNSPELRGDIWSLWYMYDAISTVKCWFVAFASEKYRILQAHNCTWFGIIYPFNKEIKWTVNLLWKHLPHGHYKKKYRANRCVTKCFEIEIWDICQPFFVCIIKPKYRWLNECLAA